MDFNDEDGEIQIINDNRIQNENKPNFPYKKNKIFNNKELLDKFISYMKCDNHIEAIKWELGKHIFTRDKCYSAKQKQFVKDDVKRQDIRELIDIILKNINYEEIFSSYKN